MTDRKMDSNKQFPFKQIQGLSCESKKNSRFSKSSAKLCVCFVDPERGQRAVYGDQTLCVREPHSPGELREKPWRGGLESRPGEAHSLPSLQRPGRSRLMRHA